MITRMLLLMLATLQLAVAAPAPAITAGIVTGSAFVLKADGQKVALVAGMKIETGWQVVTDAGASVDLMLPEGQGALRVGADATLRLDAPPASTDGQTATRLTLVAGQVSGTLDLPANSSLQISTAQGVVQLAKTGFSLTSAGALVVQSGQASYSPANGSAAVLVAANQMLLPGASGPQPAGAENLGQLAQIITSLSGEIALLGPAGANAPNPASRGGNSPNVQSLNPPRLRNASPL